MLQGVIDFHDHRRGLLGRRGLKPNQTIIVEDAIKGLVTKSANDAAVVVAEAIGGSEEEFAALMTMKARALGMRIL